MREKHDLWYWYHNVSECYYHIQITVKYRKALIGKRVEGVIVESLRGVKERYAIEIQAIGFDRNHIHILCRFLPKYSGGQVVRLIKSITAQQVFKEVREVKRALWGGEFWTDGYYIATISGRGDKKVIEEYIRKQGRAEDIEQLKLFEISTMTPCALGAGWFTRKFWDTKLNLRRSQRAVSGQFFARSMMMARGCWNGSIQGLFMKSNLDYTNHN